MKDTTPTLLLATLLLLPVAPAAASEDEPRLDIDVTGMDAGLVFGQLARALGARGYQVAGTCGPLTLRLERVRPETALTAACESLGCSWRLEDEKLRIECSEGPNGGGGVGLEEVLSFSFEDAPLVSIMESVAGILRGELAIDAVGEELVTIEVEDRPLREGLDAVCSSVGCFWRYDPSARELIVRRAGYAIDIELAPADVPGIYRCRASVRDLATGEVVSAPTVAFREGEGATVTSGLAEGGTVELAVELAEGSRVGSFEVVVTSAAGEMVAAQSSRLAVD